MTYAPADVIARIRETDPTAELLYFGWGKWYLVRYRPNRMWQHKAMPRIKDALRLLQQWQDLPRYRANPGAFRRLYARLLFWQMVYQGGRPVAEYSAKEVRAHGLEYIADDFRRMEWMLRNLVANDYQLDEQLNGEKDRAAQLARDEFKNLDRAKDAWKYLFTLSHSVSRHDDPERPRHRSGFTTVAAIGADGKRKVTA